MLKLATSLALVFCSVAATTLQAHFLWKVETDPPGYLYGTIHTSDPAVSLLPTEVTEALSSSLSFHPEIEFSPENVGKLTAALFTSGDGGDLEQALPAELWNRVVRIGNGVGFPTPLLRRISPKIIPLAFASPPEADFNRIVDIQLYELAKENGLRMEALETIEEQMAVFENLTPEDSLRFLEDSLDEFEAGFPSLRKTIDMYAAGDLGALHDYLVQEMAESGSPDLIDSLLHDRNRIMAKRLLPHLQKGGAFVAVGVGHMPGDRGLVALLEKEGFKIVPVLPSAAAEE